MSKRSQSIMLLIHVARLPEACKGLAHVLLVSPELQSGCTAGHVLHVVAQPDTAAGKQSREEAAGTMLTGPAGSRAARGAVVCLRSPGRSPAPSREAPPVGF